MKKEKNTKGRGIFLRIVTAILALILAGAALCALAVGLSVPMNARFGESFYKIVTTKATHNVRIIQISDLHNTEFGEDNEYLVERVRKLEPDIIILSGDIIDSRDDSYDTAISLCRRLAEIAPTCYAYGNNECKAEYDLPMTLVSLEEIETGDGHDTSTITRISTKLEDALEEVGVRVLLNEMTEIEVDGMYVDVYGVLTTNPSAFWPYVKETFDGYINENTDHVKVLVCHEPYVFEQFGADNWGDIILCGHTHGGIVRLPVVGALYEQSHGLFPELGGAAVYIGGEYYCGNTPLIVSRGLSNRTMHEPNGGGSIFERIPSVRVNNRPELVVVDTGR